MAVFSLFKICIFCYPAQWCSWASLFQFVINKAQVEGRNETVLFTKASSAEEIIFYTGTRYEGDSHRNFTRARKTSRS